jgi:hypothetical protein
VTETLAQSLERQLDYWLRQWLWALDRGDELGAGTALRFAENVSEMMERNSRKR